MISEYKEISVQDTMDRLNTNEEMVFRLIKMTLSSDMLEKAIASFTEGNIEEAQRAIHTIKGTAANSGLTGLSKLALEIELKIKENEFLDFELLEVLKEVWNELKNEHAQ